MSIATYSELKTAIAAWQNKTSLTPYLGDFIRLAEAKLNRRLRLMQFETPMGPTAIGANIADLSNVIPKPADLNVIKAIWVVGADQRTLDAKPLEYIMRQPVNSGLPTCYAFTVTSLGTRIIFDATGATVDMVYYAFAPALSDLAATNSLLTENPDLYLYASIEQAAIYLKDEAAEKKYGALTNSLIEELNGINTANQYAGPLRARAR